VLMWLIVAALVVAAIPMVLAVLFIWALALVALGSLGA